eukprot:TRINITY_DN6102_c1_g2_i1.p1 TRINITY_DN6102_c1_g2~~TRINITY_DN6102_c1_g2_i1.p1  ORF type:complete len:901 (+),score=204.87 TRINITY_DN6102_c1_g2_i1:931-3633(+)
MWRGLGSQGGWARPPPSAAHRALGRREVMEASRGPDRGHRGGLSTPPNSLARRDRACCAPCAQSSLPPIRKFCQGRTVVESRVLVRSYGVYSCACRRRRSHSTALSSTLRRVCASAVSSLSLSSRRSTSFTTTSSSASKVRVPSFSLFLSQWLSRKVSTHRTCCGAGAAVIASRSRSLARVQCHSSSSSVPATAWIVQAPPPFVGRSIPHHIRFPLMTIPLLDLQAKVKKLEVWVGFFMPATASQLNVRGGKLPCLRSSTAEGGFSASCLGKVTSNGAARDGIRELALAAEERDALEDEAAAAKVEGEKLRAAVKELERNAAAAAEEFRRDLAAQAEQARRDAEAAKRERVREVEAAKAAALAQQDSLATDVSAERERMKRQQQQVEADAERERDRLKAQCEERVGQLEHEFAAKERSYLQRLEQRDRDAALRDETCRRDKDAVERECQQRLDQRDRDHADRFDTAQRDAARALDEKTREWAAAKAALEREHREALGTLEQAVQEKADAHEAVVLESEQLSERLSTQRAQLEAHASTITHLEAEAAAAQQAAETKLAHVSTRLQSAEEARNEQVLEVAHQKEAWDAERLKILDQGVSLQAAIDGLEKTVRSKEAAVVTLEEQAEAAASTHDAERQRLLERVSALESSQSELALIQARLRAENDRLRDFIHKQESEMQQRDREQSIARSQAVMSESVGHQGAIGIDLDTHTLCITRVIPSSPAFHAGLRKGDRIIALRTHPGAEPTPIDCVHVLRTALSLSAGVSEGSTVEMTVSRKHQRRTVQVTLAQDDGAVASTMMRHLRVLQDDYPEMDVQRVTLLATDEAALTDELLASLGEHALTPEHIARCCASVNAALGLPVFAPQAVRDAARGGGGAQLAADVVPRLKDLFYTSLKQLELGQ